MTGRGPRGFPRCRQDGCGAEGIGPQMPWCVAHWTPERDPAGAASWDALARRSGMAEPSPSAACDASPMAIRDGSARAPCDVSRPDPGDPSARGGRDASAAAAGDASAPGPCDAFAVVAADVPAPVPGDGSRAPCAWCGGPVPAAARRDAVCCSKRCRQARHRFGRAAGRAQAAAAVVALRLAYADPPYPGKARYYRGHPDYAGEVDHAGLIARLAGYDGWALSTSAAALPAVLALCPAGVRVAAWHRGERPAASWQPLAAWEPVIYVPARPVDPGRGRRPDSLVHGVSAMTALPGRVIGAKPPAVCRWIFGLLGAARGDQLDDLFPGSGAVGRAWAAYIAEPSPGSARDTSPGCSRDAKAAS